MHRAAGAGLFLCARGARFSVKSMPTHRRLKKKHNQHTAESWILTREKCLSCAKQRLNEGGFTEIHEWELGRPGKRTGKPAISGDPELPGSLPLLQPLRSRSSGAGGHTRAGGLRAQAPRLGGCSGSGGQRRPPPAAARRLRPPPGPAPRPAPPAQGRLQQAAAAPLPARGEAGARRRAGLGGAPLRAPPAAVFWGRKSGDAAWGNAARAGHRRPLPGLSCGICFVAALAQTRRSHKEIALAAWQAHLRLSSKALWQLRTVEIIVRK